MRKIANICFLSKALWILALAISPGFFPGAFPVCARQVQIEKKMAQYIASEDFADLHEDRRCHFEAKYRICLIDNFEQKFPLVPVVETSHGEMLLKLLLSGRDDIEVEVYNTSLSKGLAKALEYLACGGCLDAVISSVPGSNYTYDQIGSLFDDRGPVTAENISEHRDDLKRLLRDIALHGFPSVQWLERADVNTVKLKNDARKFAFIEALGRFDVPVVLPYGNPDSRYKGKAKVVNLLSLSSNAKTFSALDREGKRMPGFPYSPLSSGEEKGVYDIVECPHPEDPRSACLDINEDGHCDYEFVRTGKVPYRDEDGELCFAPPIISEEKFEELVSRTPVEEKGMIETQAVLTSRQYLLWKNAFGPSDAPVPTKSYVWLDSPSRGRFFEFDAVCRKRGRIEGASVIPPNKIKELLPPKEMGDVRHETSKNP